MKITHGLSKHPLYTLWGAMLQRCNNPRHQNYPYYGGRGIRVLFADFPAFLEHIGPRPSLAHSVDRIDCNGHYAPGNVRWATRKEQAHNLAAGAHHNELRTHCKRGHEYTPENTYVRKDRPKSRECRICRDNADLKSYVLVKKARREKAKAAHG